MSDDLINRTDAIDAICKVWCYTTYGMCPHDDGYCKGCDEIEAIDALPSAETTGALDDAIAKYVADGLMELPSAESVPIQAEKCEDCIHNGINKDKMTCKECTSIEVEPKWTCTANFIAEQLERLKNMTDEERLKLLQTMFPSTEANSDGKFFKYKLKGDIVQSYEIVPSVEAAQGEWIKSKSAKGYVVCSNCNKLTTNINCKKYNYCPFCGARMKGASHETNKR